MSEFLPDEAQLRSRRAWRWGRLAFLALFPLLLAALALWFGSEYRRLGTVEDDANRAHSRQLLVSELFSATKDAETGQRGYVITGDDTFLEPYRSGQKEVHEHLAALRKLPTSPAEQSRLERLNLLVDAKFVEMERVLEIRRNSGLAAAAELVSAGRGKQLMDEIRREAASAQKAEAEMLAATIERQDQRTATTVRIIWVIVAFIAATFLFMGIIFLRNERERAALERQAHEAAARRRAIFDSTLDAIVLINPSGSVETINRSASQLFGYGEGDLVRRDIAFIVDLAPGEGAFLDRVGLTPDGLSEPFRHRLTARRADGTAIPVEAALGVMPLPDGIHIVAAFRDISEREKAERIKDQFLSTVSHELRTPLTSIVGSLGLLRGGANGDLAPAVQRLLVIAENNAHRLIRLVNDLLDIEKFESGEMSFEFAPIDLRDNAARALDAMRGMAAEKGVTLELEQGDKPVTVRADADRLTQVITNLLANATRFTPANGTVRLLVTRRTSHAEVSVIDQGPGIDAELRGRLFTRFAQSIQAPAGMSRGTGLGLAISREIVRNHGGGIWYDPAPGGGSAFSFNLPLWNTVTGQVENGATPRVLICATGHEAGLIAAALEQRQIHADVVDSEGVLAALGREAYLALLVDAKCLGAKAALLHRVHSLSATRGLPIIAIEAGEGTGASADFALLDLVDWIPRPIDRARLDAALDSVIIRARRSLPLILHVDDDTDTLEITAVALEGRARMARATDIASARAFIAENRPDVVIVDLALPDGSGEELVADLGPAHERAMPVIIYSAQERDGAFANEVSAVLTKSRRSLPALVETIIRILDE